MYKLMQVSIINKYQTHCYSREYILSSKCTTAECYEFARFLWNANSFHIFNRMRLVSLRQVNKFTPNYQFGKFSKAVVWHAISSSPPLRQIKSRMSTYIETKISMLTDNCNFESHKSQNRIVWNALFQGIIKPDSNQNSINNYQCVVHPMLQFDIHN